MKLKRIIAIIVLIFLVLLYGSTLVFALFDTTTSLVYLKISIAATIFFPVMFYIISMFMKLSAKNSSGNTHTPIAETADTIGKADEINSSIGATDTKEEILNPSDPSAP